MSGHLLSKRGLILLGVLTVLIAAGMLGFRAAVGLLKDKVVQALGPGSEIKGLRVGWATVELTGLRIRAGEGWPAADALRADRVVLVPSLRTLLSDRIRVGSVTVVGPYLSAVRTREGRLRVLPGLTARAKPEPLAAPGIPARTVTLTRITLHDGVVEVFDAAADRPPLKTRLEQMQATVHDVVAPTLTGRTRFDFTGVVKGVQQDGRITASGWVEAAETDASVTLELTSVDLVAFQSYLTRTAEAQLRKGVVDLRVDARVTRRRLHAPGRAVLSGLEFTPGGAGPDTFMGLPRAAVVELLKHRDHMIEVDFVIEGDLGHPRFSINEFIARRIAAGVADQARGAVKGLQGRGRKVGEQSGKTGKAVEGVLGESTGVIGDKAGR